RRKPSARIKGGEEAFRPHSKSQGMMRLTSLALATAISLAGCSGFGTAPQSVVPQAASSPTRLAPAAKHPRQTLYVLVNNGTYASYVALYDAYAKNPTMIGKITNGLANPGAIWTDSKGDVFVGNDMTYTSSVTEYAPRTYKLIQTYTNAIDLPFGGMVDSKGTMYVSVAGVKGQTEGGIAVFPPGKTSPSTILTAGVYVPHGLAKDSAGHLFLAQIYGSQSSVIEFPKAANKSKVLPLNDLNTGAFLEDLKLDAHNDVVVADAELNSVRFYPPPYKKESMALDSGVSTPTALAYGADGTLFVGDEYAGANGNVVVFPPGATQPTVRITDGITGGVLGVAVSPAK
ncbi:MAG: hypothetical protein WAJ94_03465, partial [Candidatus Cybelea sp.]